MDRTKIGLSPAERELVTQADWILTKNAVLQKAQLLLSTVAEGYRSRLDALTNIPDELRRIPAKISRGEQYQGLPWLMLDHPRSFTKESVCAIRTFFWWGHCFSITLHLAGGPLDDLKNKLTHAFASLKDAGYVIATGTDPWQHDLRSADYRNLLDCTVTDWSGWLGERPFIKVGTMLPVAQWDNAAEWLMNEFERLTGLLWT
ncbi:MAG: hypothetical protein RJA57_1894 [Bacteroidota bacterium]|jgi:hypothetical protein